MTAFNNTIPTIASGDTTTVPTNLATYRDALKAVSEAWTSYTPTYTNFTLGNGVATAAYMRVTKLVTFRVRITLGSTSSITAAMSISLPISSHAQAQIAPCFIGSNTGSTPLIGMGYLPGGANVQPFHPTSTTNGTAVQLGSVALTMGTGSYIMLEGTYEAA